MKSIILAGAILSCAVAGAVTVNWTSGDLSSIAPEQTVTAYYIVIDKTDAEVAQSLNSEAIYSQYAIGKFDNPSTYSTEQNFLNVANYDQEVADVSADNPAYILAVYTYNADGKSYYLADVAKYVPSEAMASSPDPLLSSSDEIAVNAFRKNNNAWSVVPEPGTVALLAVGLAAIGFKRKVA